MAITSQREKIAFIGEYPIENWQGAGLLKPSVIKPVISTIEQKLVLKKLGRLSDNDLKAMEQKIKELLGLNR